MTILPAIRGLDGASRGGMGGGPGLALLLVLWPALPAQEAGRDPARSLPAASYGPLELEGYSVREVIFEEPQREILSSGEVRLHRAGFQLTIFAKQFPVRALDPFVHVGPHVLKHYDPVLDSDVPALAYTFFDPTLLRAQWPLTVMYGDDERTRTAWPEGFDPERLERLGAEQRRRADLPEVEGLTLQSVARSGLVKARGHWGAGGQMRLALVLPGERLRVDPAVPAFTAGGGLQARIELGRTPAGRVALLWIPEGEVVGTRIYGQLPAGWEILDIKPVQ